MCRKETFGPENQKWLTRLLLSAVRRKAEDSETLTDIVKVFKVSSSSELTYSIQMTLIWFQMKATP